MSFAGIYKGLEYESLRHGEGPTTTNQASLLRTRRCGLKRLTSRIFPSATVNNASSWRTRKYGHCVFSLHLLDSEIY